MFLCMYPCFCQSPYFAKSSIKPAINKHLEAGRGESRILFVPIRQIKAKAGLVSLVDIISYTAY